MQPLGTKKNHTNSWGKKCPKNAILVTNKIQEIGTGHLGLVFLFFQKIFRAQQSFKPN